MPKLHDKDVTEIFKALSHPIRQQIILILAESHENQGVGFTVLQSLLNSKKSSKPIQVGSIYHHIGLLGSLLEQTPEKAWILSKSGWFAYNLLDSTQDRTEFLNKGDLKKSSPLSNIWNILAPSSLFFFVKNSLLMFIGWLILFFLLFAGVTAESESVLVFLFFNAVNSDSNYFLSLLSILFSWFVLSAVTILITKIQLREKTILFKDILSISTLLGISLLPLAIIPILAIINLINIQTENIFSLSGAILLQIWVIILSARAISVYFIVRLDRAAIVSIISVYIMVLLGLLLEF
ncbi:MAG: hypothetical protein ACXABU_00450 [Candidatus Hodarchaeales archaeon]|jgi:hypothetical protein